MRSIDNSCGNDFKHHRSKNVAWIIPRLVIQGARTLESLRIAADQSAEHTEFLEEVKQKALYADFDSKSSWNEPEDQIDEAFAGYLVNTAESLASGEAVTEREIELWIEYMSPSYGAPLEHQKISLSIWYAAMRQEGHWEEGCIPVESFLWGE
ncbi:MAG: AbiV family abortive infection protein [Bryobacterales bacterium]|nr:AbiV family abortive infection protein [Bryobacterales bacterium]